MIPIPSLYIITIRLPSQALTVSPLLHLSHLLDQDITAVMDTLTVDHLVLIPVVVILHLLAAVFLLVGAVVASHPAAVAVAVVPLLAVAFLLVAVAAPQVVVVAVLLAVVAVLPVPPLDLQSSPRTPCHLNLSP